MGEVQATIAEYNNGAARKRGDRMRIKFMYITALMLGSIAHMMARMGGFCGIQKRP